MMDLLGGIQGASSAPGALLSSSPYGAALGAAGSLAEGLGGGGESSSATTGDQTGLDNIQNFTFHAPTRMGDYAPYVLGAAALGLIIYFKVKK